MAQKLVAACAANQLVIACAAKKPVIAAAAIQRVVAAEAVNPVGGFAAEINIGLLGKIYFFAIGKIPFYENIQPK